MKSVKVILSAIALVLSFTGGAVWERAKHLTNAPVAPAALDPWGHPFPSGMTFEQKMALTQRERSADACSNAVKFRGIYAEQLDWLNAHPRQILPPLCSGELPLSCELKRAQQ
jgi:hypothetical protein